MVRVGSSSPFSAVSAAYLDAMRAAFDHDPASVDPSWRVLFEALDQVEAAAPLAGDDDGAETVRSRGHLHASLDPLSGPTPPPPGPGVLVARYCGALTLETAHIDDPVLRTALRRSFEASAPAPSRDEHRALLEGMIEAEAFEGFLARKFPGKKRFGLEGAEALAPMLRRVLAQATAAGVTHAVIGAMHRGRLNLMANVLGRSLARMFVELKNGHPFPADPPRTGDVPYHLGCEATLSFGDRTIQVSLLPNPSHLEAVDAVVLGRARALQDLGGQVLPIVIHTDAAVVAQGVVAEAIQLGGTAAYGTGGTLHLVLNNGIGFTTETHEARSSRHCTGPWKAVDSAILHVNADAPLEVMRAADLAVAWRQAHACDAVIDLVGYRRNGHNEIDEPSFTQPLLYDRIAAHPTAATAFGQAALQAGLVSQAELDGIEAACQGRFQSAYDNAAGLRRNETGYRNAPVAQRDTGVEADRLHAMAAILEAVPDGFAAHPRMPRILRQRALGEEGVAWPLAEALAFAALLTEGTAVRLSGQDVVRGAFSHRHFALNDVRTGAQDMALDRLSPGQARFTAVNSPLSECAVLGFEYGYSLQRPDALVIWEAQFGDFANGAQVVIDQFIAAAEEKWCEASGLVLLLPHGLEGQGPEHSSARIERYLQLAAGDNIAIVNPSTPANYFHLLRGQTGRGKPLVVISPKKLLRLPAAVSPLTDFLPGARFRPIIATGAEAPALALLCSGKIAYELEEERQAQGAADVAVLRLEQLHPLPDEALLAQFRRWPGARFAWVQEEPENMGAWSWLDRRLERLLQQAGAAHPRVTYVGRPESASPAGSFHGAHDADQRAIVERAFALRPVALARSA